MQYPLPAFLPHIPIPVRRRREMADVYYRFFVSAAVGRGASEEDVYV